MVKLLIFQLVNRELSITIKKSALMALFFMLIRRDYPIPTNVIVSLRLLAHNNYHFF